MECAVDDAILAKHNGLEVVLLPLGIPVLALDELVAVCYLKPLEREGCNNSRHAVGVVERLWRIGRHSVLLGQETLETHLGKQCGKHVGGNFFVRGHCEFYSCIIVHAVVYILPTAHFPLGCVDGKGLFFMLFSAKILFLPFMCKPGGCNLALTHVQQWGSACWRVLICPERCCRHSRSSL